VVPNKVTSRKRFMMNSRYGKLERSSVCRRAHIAALISRKPRAAGGKYQDMRRLLTMQVTRHKPLQRIHLQQHCPGSCPRTPVSQTTHPPDQTLDTPRSAPSSSQLPDAV
jgi:hypothetical protein